MSSSASSGLESGAVQCRPPASRGAVTRPGGARPKMLATAAAAPRARRRRRRRLHRRRHRQAACAPLGAMSTIAERPITHCAARARSACRRRHCRRCHPTASAALARLCHVRRGVRSTIARPLPTWRTAADATSASRRRPCRQARPRRAAPPVRAGARHRTRAQRATARAAQAVRRTRRRRPMRPTAYGTTRLSRRAAGSSTR